MFLFTVAEEGSMVLLVIGILTSCRVRLSYTIKDLSTLNIVVPLLRDTCLGKKGEPAVYGTVLFLLSPLGPQTPASPALPISWQLLITISLHPTLFQGSCPAIDSGGR